MTEFDNLSSLYLWLFNRSLFHHLYPADTPSPGYYCPAGTGPFTTHPCPEGTYSDTPGMCYCYFISECLLSCCCCCCCTELLFGILALGLPYFYIIITRILSWF